MRHDSRVAYPRHFLQQEDRLTVVLVLVVVGSLVVVVGSSVVVVEV